MGRRRDDRPDIELLPVEPPPPAMPPATPTAGPTPGSIPTGAAGRPAAIRAVGAGRNRDRETDWVRWAIALGLVVAAIVAVVVFDRRSVAEPPSAAPPTTLERAPAQQRPPLSESDLPVPPGMAGTLYALGEDESLIEIDLGSGHARLAALQFDIAPWFVSQVVALEEVVLVGNRRQVFAVDRASMADQQRIADERWIVAPPSGRWAALVPFGAAAGEVVVLNGAGLPLDGAPISLPSGASVQGAVDDALVVDFAGTLQLVRLDGSPGPVLGQGRHLAAGATAVARVGCAAPGCTVLSGTVAQPDAVDLGPVDVAGAWYFGNAGVFDATGSHLAVIAPGEGAEGVARIFDATGRTGTEAIDSPSAVHAPRGLPPLAFSADGATLVHAWDNQLVLWRFAGDGSVAPGLDRLTFDSELLAVTVTEQPPPPPPDASGPPPSFA